MDFSISGILIESLLFDIKITHTNYNFDKQCICINRAENQSNLTFLNGQSHREATITSETNENNQILSH